MRCIIIKQFIIVRKKEKCNRNEGDDVLKIPESADRVMEVLESAGHQAWCVGGCVRDSLLGRVPEDWDITTDALPEETLDLFGEQAVPTGLRHGTITVRTKTGAIEVTTFRVDGAYRDHRRPESVCFTRSLEEDLRRRDFTINAMAVDRRGELRDPFGGRDDLRRRVLRCVGEPGQRFGEDALRILRGMRFAAVLEFSIEDRTAEGLHACRELLGEIAPERIWKELLGLLTGVDAAAVLRRFPDVVGVFWPEISRMVGFPQNNVHHCYDVWEHTLHALDAVPPEPELRLTMLLHDIGKPKCFTEDAEGNSHFHGHPAVSAAMAEEMLRRLRADNATRETVVRLVAWHDRNIPRTEEGVAKALGELGERDLRRLFQVKRADNLAQAPAFRATQAEIDKAQAILDHLLAENACVSLKQLSVKGNDLLGIGLTGRAVGKMLQALLTAVMEGNVPNSRDALLDLARELSRPCPEQSSAYSAGESL